MCTSNYLGSIVNLCHFWEVSEEVQDSLCCPPFSWKKVCVHAWPLMLQLNALFYCQPGRTRTRQGCLLQLFPV